MVSSRAEADAATGHGEVFDNDRFQGPAEPATGDLGPRRGGLRRVLPPRLPAVRAPVAAHPHQQDRGPVPERWLGRARLRGSLLAR